MSRLISSLLALTLSINLCIASDGFTSSPSIDQIQDLQEEGDINDLDRYVLRNRLCNHENNEHVLRDCTLKYLPDDVLIEIVQKELQDLKKVIEKSKKYLTVDEALRKQTWSLGETIGILSSRGMSLPRAKELQGEAIDLLEKAYNRYQVVSEEINVIIQSYFNQMNETPEALAFQDASHLISQAELIPLKAGQLEEEMALRKWNKTHEACGATGRALLFYFAEKYGIKSELQKTIESSEFGVSNFLKHLESKRDQNQQDTLYFLESDKVDHVFVVIQSREGLYRIYQSYVSSYSLKAFIAEQRQSETSQGYLTYEEVVKFFENLETIESASEWNPEIANLHEQLFMNEAPPHVIQAIQKGTNRDFKFMTLNFVAA